jgi:hypothetical protein
LGLDVERVVIDVERLSMKGDDRNAVNHLVTDEVVRGD